MEETVWVIEQGSYSDYRVVGVFSSRENAEAIAAKINGAGAYDQATVQEWPMDPGVDDLNAGREPYNILMLRDGTVERAEKSDSSYAWQYEVGGSFRVWRRSTAPAYKGKGIPDALQATVFATDEKHAVKIANEKRAQMIATGEWA